MPNPDELCRRNEVSSCQLSQKKDVPALHGCSRPHEEWYASRVLGLLLDCGPNCHAGRPLILIVSGSQEPGAHDVWYYCMSKEMDWLE